MALPGIALHGLTIIGKYVDCVVTLSVSHSWNWNEIVESDCLRPISVGFDNNPIELRFLAFLLIFEILYFGESRISSPQSPYRLWNALSHWTKESENHQD